MTTTWPALVKQMRQLGWEVEVQVGMIYVMTPDGLEIGFGRHPEGLQLACRFYERYSQPEPSFPVQPVMASPVSPSRYYSPRVVSTTNRRMTASFVLLACFAVIVLATYHGLLVPAHGLICLIVMLLALLVSCFFVRRVL